MAALLATARGNLELVVDLDGGVQAKFDTVCVPSATLVLSPAECA